MIGASPFSPLVGSMGPLFGALVFLMLVTAVPVAAPLQPSLPDLKAG